MTTDQVKCEKSREAGDSDRQHLRRRQVEVVARHSIRLAALSRHGVDILLPAHEMLYTAAHEVRHARMHLDGGQGEISVCVEDGEVC